jgi:hypothetical protein
MVKYGLRSYREKILARKHGKNSAQDVKYFEDF